MKTTLRFMGSAGSLRRRILCAELLNTKFGLACEQDLGYRLVQSKTNSMEVYCLTIVTTKNRFHVYDSILEDIHTYNLNVGPSRSIMLCTKQIFVQTPQARQMLYKMKMSSFGTCLQLMPSSISFMIALVQLEFTLSVLFFVTFSVYQKNNK